jgi:arylsulfatase A-like enzyme/Tfp pilus assembly protein PilF
MGCVAKDSASPNERARARPRRRRLVIGLLVWVAVAAGPACRQAERETPGTAAPRELLGGIEPSALNLVLVTIDTLRADHVGCYGDSPVETPNLDRFAREGVRFENAASTVPFTLPAHASIMTGLYPPRHGIRENVGYFLGDATPTAAELLAAGGRDTAGFVSAFVLDSRWGIGRGFDRYFDDFGAEELDTRNLGAVQRPGNETLAEAVHWLDERDPSSPFFLWLHLYDPHDPYTPPEPYASQHPGHPYLGEVAFTDALIGSFREELEKRGLLERSLLILTADHGEGLGDHGERFHGYFVYETTVQVPLILRLPGAARAGAVVADPVSHVDLLPTLLDAAGLTIPASAQGTSLLPAIASGRLDAAREVYSESFYPLLHYGWSPLRSIRAEHHKLIAAPRPELYDLVDDRGESRNLIADEPQLAFALDGRLRALRAEMEREAPAAKTAADLDPETVDRLRALGYLPGGGGVSAALEDERPRADPKDTIDLHQMIMASQSLIGRGDNEAAAELLGRVLARDPRILDAHQMMGQIAFAGERYEEAVERYRQALAIDGDHRASLHGLATAYRKLGRDQDAIVGFEHLLELEHHSLAVALPLAEIYEQAGRVDDAAVVLEAADAGPEPPAILYNRLGELRVLQGRPGEATPLFEKAIAANPELPGPYFNAAVLYEESGEEEQAIVRYEQAIERAPNHYQAQFNLGRLYGGRGDAARQQAMWEAAIDSNTDFVRGYYYLAKLLMDRGGDLARAEELARTGIARDTTGQGGPLGYFVLADLLNRRGRTDEAQAALAKGRALQGQG